MIAFFGLESTMAQAEVGTHADIRKPPRIAREAWNGIEDVQVDAEQRGELAHADFNAGTKLEIGVEYRAERRVGTDIENLRIETDATLHSDTKAFGGALDVGGGLLACLRNVLRSGEGSARGRGGRLLCTCEVRRQRERQKRNESN